LRATQLGIFEELLQLEAHVSTEVLPKHFDRLEMFIVSDDLYSPVVNDHLAVEFRQQRCKIIQEVKRTWLNIFMNAYEIQYQDYEHQYREERGKLQVLCANDRQADGTTASASFDAFVAYVDHRTNRMKQEIYSEKIPVYRRKLLRLRRRRQCSQSDRQKKVTIRPTLILDLIRHPFTAVELAFLSRGNRISSSAHTCAFIVVFVFFSQVPIISDPIKVHFDQSDNERNKWTRSSTASCID
jgi:hypothetical protein